MIFQRVLRCWRVVSPVALIIAVGCTERSGQATLPVPSATARRADVVLITMDTTRADHIGCYGWTPSQTPVIDRLCSEGVRFSNAVTPAPVTLPAHTSLLTGLAPPRHGVRYNGEFALDESVPTLATLLRADGYRTAAFVSSFVLDHRFGLARGFDVYDDRVESSRTIQGVAGQNERRAAATTDAALAYLSTRDKEKPLFLWVHYFDPHAPYAPVGKPAANDLASAYAAEIGDVDEAIGRLLSSPGFERDNAIIIVTADHGEGLGEHGERTHGLFIHDSTTRIPMVVRLPRAERAGTRIDDLVSLTDLTPTVLSLVGSASPADLDGIDWTASRRGPMQAIYQEAALPYFDFGFAPTVGIRTKSARLVDGIHPVLFDLATDPGEQRVVDAVATDDPASAASRLRGLLDAELLRAMPIAEAANRAPPSDPWVLARLQSLGYLVGNRPAADVELPSDPRTLIQVADLHQDAAALVNGRHFGEAIALLDRADRIAPDNIALLRLRSKTQVLAGRVDDAKRTLEQLLGLRANPDSLILLAQIHILHGNNEEAKTLLDEAQRLEPAHGGIFVARGDMALQAGDPAMARTFYEKAISTDPYRIGGIARGRLASMTR